MWLFWPLSLASAAVVAPVVAVTVATTASLSS